MVPISNISITHRALELLRKERARFQPRNRGDVFALLYMSSFTNADGTTVDGFRPGYVSDSVSPAGLGDMWGLARLGGELDFLFMPKFEWRSTEDYIVDMASETFVIFSIGPVSR